MSLYDSIEKSIREHEEILHVTNEIMESDVRHAIRWVMRDNPDIFWFVHQYHFDKNDGIVSFRYRCSPERCAIIQKSIDDVVVNDFKIAHVHTLSQLEQVAYVYKWMLTYCNYNTNSAYNQDIDSVFVRRNSVCTGYAKAAQYLFKLLGIESRLVFGQLNKAGRHCWNTVCIEGRYYHLDICLGDLSLQDVMKKAGVTYIRRYGDYNYNCFCVSTDEILKTRSIEDVETLLLCNTNLPTDEIERLSCVDIKERNGVFGCQLTHIGSSADIFLCAKDKDVVLKKFREDDTHKCEEEYGFMDSLRGCKHLLHLNSAYSDIGNNILAIEQSTPIVDLLCDHRYHLTLNEVLKMIKDIILGWLECQQQGIMYRDIHVSNIYKANDGSYKLGDFGSCTYELRGLRERVGSPWFMSPETYIGGQFDERSAVYSITAVLYFVLNGLRPPFVDGHNEEEALQRKMNGEALPEPVLLHSFPNDLDKVKIVELIARGCAFYPSKRIETCMELIFNIETLGLSINCQRFELSKTIPNVMHHRFASGEEVERIAISVAHSFPQEDIEVMATTAVNWKDAFTIDSEGEIDMDCLSNVILDELITDNDTDGCSPSNNEVFFSGSKTTGCIGDSMYDLDFEAQIQVEKIWEKEVNLLTEIASEGFAGPPIKEHEKTGLTYEPSIENGEQVENDRGSFWSRVFKKRTAIEKIYSSIFAPAEVKRKSRMLVQVYLHLFEETEKVKDLASESDKNAERRDYIPLQCKLSKGDKVNVLLNIYGDTLQMSDEKSVVWQGSFTKCSFDYFVPKDIDVDELSCVALLSVNGVPVGEMRFITKIVEQPRQLYPEIIAHKYSKVFISYSHQDESKVKFLHEGLELGAVPHFFDRKYLKAGDVFPQVIQDYINSADLFILCWSENASKSEYVQKERLQALERAFPQVQPEKAAKLRIYPMSIEPRAELPSDMKDNYHFGEM